MSTADLPAVLSLYKQLNFYGMINEILVEQN